jgi:hypothetical protein
MVKNNAGQHTMELAGAASNYSEAFGTMDS